MGATESSCSRITPRRRNDAFCGISPSSNWAPYSNGPSAVVADKPALGSPHFPWGRLPFRLELARPIGFPQQMQEIPQSHQASEDVGGSGGQLGAGWPGGTADARSAPGTQARQVI